MKQCPHCYKTDLHPDASRCHHCGGQYIYGEAAGIFIVVSILGVIVALIYMYFYFKYTS
jgi:uncharacterized protein (DUF983 family)